MILTIDIGNSTTKFGIFKGEKLVNKYTFLTNRNESDKSIYKQIGKQIPNSISAIIISTVVNELKETYKSFGEKYFKQTPFFVDHKFDFGFDINYFPPKNCGSDRLVAAFAALETVHIGTPLIICDFGTASTIDVVNADNQYLGGIISPGPNTLGSALFEKTSKLPNVEFNVPEKVIGNSTVSSIQSGIYFGYVGLVDGIIERMFEELGESLFSIVSTGGFAELISKKSKYIQDEFIYKNLLLDGLRLVNEKLNGN